ncbi:MAG: ATP-binding protein [Patescibacteria group bacterium]|nr:ATP-binding protein [Patescibacteria group bacterium]
MRIAVIGTQRSGKTTLVEHFQSCEGIHIVREAALDLILELGSNIVFDPNFQDMLFAEQTRREIEADRLLREGASCAWLCDRTIIDNLVYIRYLRSIYTGEQSPEEVYPIRAEWLEYIRGNPFDLILLCDPGDIELTAGMNVAWEGDSPGAREGLESERRIRAEIHGLYIEVLRELGLEYTLLSGSVESRTAYVERFIRASEIAIAREGVSSQVEIVM